MSHSIYKIQKPGWFIKRRLLNYIFNDKNGGFHSDEGLSKLSKPRSLISKGSYRNKESTQELTRLYNKYLSSLINKSTKNSYFMNAIWYQYYAKHSGSYHDYHKHYSPECQLSGIYYLRLKDPELKTQFLNTPEIMIEEGDLILFDSQLMHRSPPNYTEYDKMILSFNLKIK